VNIEGHAAHIWMRLQSSEWREFTTAMDVQFKLFRDVGLIPLHRTTLFGDSAKLADITC